MNRFRRSKPHRRGYALPELLLGAAIIATFLMKVYQGYSATRESDQYENFVSQLTAISALTLANNQQTPDYSTVSDFTVAGQLPVSMVQSLTGTTAKLVTSYHQPISIKPIDSSLAGVLSSKNGLEIHAVIPQGACFRLAMAAPQIFTYMAVSSDGSSEQAFPLSNTDAASLCGATDGTVLKDVWLYVVPPGATVASR